jgi:glutamyl-tRNA synthetase
VSTPYIGRLAPSPTGLLHLGHAATFWTAFTRAREANGTLLLRNEDLDPQRSRPEFVSAMLEDLAWLGIAWQPPMLSQSARLPAYRAAFEQLLASGHSYPCTCTRRDLAQMMAAPHDEDDEPIYTGHCRPENGRCRPAHPSPQTLAAANYRFRVPDGETIRFLDLNLGPQAFTAGCGTGSARGSSENAFGDFLIWRKPTSTAGAPHLGVPGELARGGEHLDADMWDATDGLPSYQLACVVDDACQRVTEVVRGADLLKSAARQILLQRALGLPPVAYFHTTLLRDDRGVRLAKRHDALALRTLRAAGLTPAEVLARIAA